MLNVLKNYMKFTMIYHFLPEKMKIGKIGKLAANLVDKEKYVVHRRNLKQTLDHGLVLKKVHGVIKFSQEAWLKPYIYTNTELRKSAKSNFEKDFFKLMSNAFFFRKTIENMRKYRDIKLVITKARKNYLVLEPNYHTKNFFSECLLAIEI